MTTDLAAYRPVVLRRYDEVNQSTVIETLEFEGRVIGSASSEKDTHIGHPHADYAPRHIKCSACRWLEVTIYQRRQTRELTSDDNPTYGYDYVIHTIGVSDVPDEIDFVRIHQTTSAFEVIELLTVRRTNRFTGKVDAFLPPQHAQALAQAAAIDDEIREAYVNRAVA